MATFVGNFKDLFPGGVPRPGMTTAQQPNYGTPKSGGVVPAAKLQGAAPTAPTYYPGMNTGSTVPANQGPAAALKPLGTALSGIASAFAKGFDVANVPAPKRWNPDATPDEQLAYFGDKSHLQDTRADILGIKNKYNEYVQAGQMDKANLAHDWAKKVRSAAGISEDDVMYGNGVLKPTQSTSSASMEPQQPQQPQQPQVPQYFNPGSVPQAPQMPVYAPQMPVRDRGAIEKYVNEQIAAKLARSRSEADQTINAGRSTATQQLGAIKTQFDRQKTDITEGRTLEDWKVDQSMDPANGMTNYRKSMMDRERGRSDREMDQDLATRQANVSQSLADLENGINAKYAALQETSGAERERLQMDIERDERQYELAMRGESRSDILANSQLTQAEFQKALQSFQTNRGVLESDRGFGLQEGQLTGNYKGGQTLAAQQFALQNKQANWDAYKDSTQLTGNLGSGAKSDWGNLGGTGGAPTYGAQQDALKNGQWQQQFEYGQQMDAAKMQQQSQQFAQSMGLDWAKMSQDQQQFVSNMAMQQSKFDWDKDASNPDNIFKSAQIQELTGKGGQKLQDESKGLVEALRGGQMSPASAIQQIDEDVQLGFYTPDEAAHLKSIITTLAPKLPVPKEQTQPPANLPSNAELDRLYKEQGNGAPMIDWKMWYRDPKGKSADVPYATWKQLYGPSLGPSKK